MIEEQVETGLKALLESYKPTYIPGGPAPDMLDDRFTLIPSEPIPGFSHAYADAFEATDANNTARQMYAMVHTNKLPTRAQAVHDLEGVVTPAVSLPLGSGVVRCSHLGGEARYVLFFERPQGVPLSEVIATQTRIHETRIRDLVLEPICKALTILREKKISHGNIRPEAFFIGDTPVLGECFSAPAGTLGHYLYEPIERMMASPLGHGQPDEKSDMYALGILVYELIYGLDKLKAMPREEFIQRVLLQGTHPVFADNRDFSDHFQDFFRGILNDNPADRWGLEQLTQYISGKRFNMIAPSAPKDASRPLIFMQENYFSRRLLANAFHKNWRDAIKDVRSNNLVRWCENSLHRPELAERIERVVRNAGANASDKQATDMMIRVLAVLDPTGPLRTKTMALRPDAIGLMLTEHMTENSTEMNQLLHMTQSNVASFWQDQAETNKSPEMSQIIWKLQRVKPYMDTRVLGFGIERILYELNPTLCCQSPLLKPYCVTTAAEALKALDMLAKTHAPSIMADRHIAAFIAAKIELNKPIRMTDLAVLPELVDDPELTMITLLSKAQMKSQQIRLVGLSTWAGMRIELLLNQIHNRIIRKRQKLILKKLASTGQLSRVLSSIVNRDVLKRDKDGFAQAVALYDINTKRIEFLQSSLVLEYKARKSGGKMAISISHIALVITAYIVMMNLMGL